MQHKLMIPPYSVRFSCEDVNLATLRNGGISISMVLTQQPACKKEKVLGNSYDVAASCVIVLVGNSNGQQTKTHKINK